VGFCEHGNELSFSVKGREFLEQLNDYQLLKHYAPWSSLYVFIHLVQMPLNLNLRT
jgi:hypothetical protein